MWPVSQLAKSHPQLMTRLLRFDAVPAGKLIAALALAPDLHANALRIEALTHLVAFGCKRKAIPDGRTLVEWVRFMGDSPLAPHEDPIEDIFIGCVNCGSGSFRLFKGVTGNKDFGIERLLLQLEQKLDFPPFRATRDEAVALLKLSDALAGRVGLERYSQGGGQASKRFAVPHRSEMQDLLRALTFTRADLEEIGIDPSALAPFLFPDADRPTLEAQTIWHSTLCSRPIRAAGEDIEVLMPSSFARALQQHLLQGYLRTGMGGWSEEFFRIACANEFVNDIRPAMGIRSMGFDPPPPPDDLPPLYPFFGQFDVGKPVILLNYYGSLEGALDDPEGHDGMSEAEIAATISFLQACAERFEKIPGFSGGLILINVVGLRTMMFGIPWSRDRWRMQSSGMADWLILSAHSECDAARLWRFGQQLAKLEAGGTRLIDMAGFLNTYGYWKTNDYRLLRRDMSRSTTMLSLTCDFGVHLRADVLQREDVHGVPSHDGSTSVRLERLYAWPLFEEDADLSLYGDREAAREGQLMACIERESFRCWISASTTDLPSEIRQMAYQIWDCVANWAARTALIMEDQLPPTDILSVEFRIDLIGTEAWGYDEADFAGVPPAELEVTVDREKATTTLGISRGFLVHFCNPKNLAEMKIVTALVEAMGSMWGLVLPKEKCDAVVRSVLPNEDARHFHMFRATEMEFLLAGSGRSDPLFAREEDLAVAHASVADLVGAPQAGHTVTGREACLELLKDAVAKVWELLESRLRQIGHTALVAACFAELDELHRDEEQWDWTSRSALALHRNQEAVHEVLHDRRHERHRASLANRLLIEISQYATGPESAPVLNQLDHRELSAYVIVLLELAHHRDAVSYGFMRPEITVHPNGEIGVDEAFYEQVVSPYFAQRSLEQTESAVANYERRYARHREAEAEPVPEMSEEVRRFDRIFAVEYGFNMTQLVDLVATLNDLAVAAQLRGGVTGEIELFGILAKAGFTDAQVRAFVERFTLPLRTKWDGELPQYCSSQDVFPWRFRRQLSLLVRPLVALSSNTWFLSIPMIRRACSYVVGNSSNGYFPEGFFSSPEMRRYVGDTANQRGHNFARRVSDEFKARGLKTELEVEMSALGAPKAEGLGDIDVLAWSPTKGRVYLIECKCLRTASSMREIVQRLEDFKGSRKEKDSLTRHLRRIEWLKKNVAALSARTGISLEKLRLVPLLVTSETVPMQFFQDMNFPAAQVVSIKALDGAI